MNLLDQRVGEVYRLVMDSVSVYDAKTPSSLRGGDVEVAVLVCDGWPLAHLVRASVPARRSFGTLRGAVTVREDFD